MISGVEIANCARTLLVGGPKHSGTELWLYLSSINGSTFYAKSYCPHLQLHNLVDEQKFLSLGQYLKLERSDSEIPNIGILFVQHSLFALHLSIFDLIHFLR